MKLPVIFALLTALCWGLYGPALAQARSGLGSPFKPYLAIGLAYLVWGVFGGFGGMFKNGDSFTFSGAGMTWGLIAGTLGAWGALTLTLAMFSGGGAMPHIVMPIVFGGAVTVSAIASVVSTKSSGTPMLWLGIVGMAVCIVIVASNTPHGAPHKPKGPEHAASTEPAASESATSPS